ncbi:uncharacterized protein F4812DRAFT_421356 [Daldinia caldariorum]|uniref:uncharacterized protein n=1 Tax=Daldinia caldariorum TaxID=326644 RepID=UPI0020083632|nr:uncharacterized protein F4812DRAFT_421356 [Daldinia caldariorum]KAI1470064.1 hypothetical protein F4812DRAFT_421356 [Daldinia caldariorum]
MHPPFNTIAHTRDSPFETLTTSSKRSHLPKTPIGIPAGPINNNLFIDGQNSPAWSVDIPLGSNPGVRGGPYVAASWTTRP